MKTPDPHAFRSGRDFAAWLGLTPKDHSTAGKTRLGVITRAGDVTLRSVLVVGATALIQQAKQGRGHPSRWLTEFLRRKPPKLAAVAVANKTARIAWKLMVSGEHYNRAHDRARTASREGRRATLSEGSTAVPLARVAITSHPSAPVMTNS
jgi:transposase